MMDYDKGFFAPKDEVRSLRAELAAERAKVADLTAALRAQTQECQRLMRILEAEEPELTAQLAAKESAEQEPVAEIVLEDMGKPFSAMAVRCHFVSPIPPVGTKLYTTTPTTSAAVAAFQKKAVEVYEDAKAHYLTLNYPANEVAMLVAACEDCRDGVLALPADESALREVCRKVTALAERAGWERGMTGSIANLEAVVDEVLK